MWPLVPSLEALCEMALVLSDHNSSSLEDKQTRYTRKPGHQGLGQGHLAGPGKNHLIGVWLEEMEHRTGADFS